MLFTRIMSVLALMVTIDKPVLSMEYLERLGLNNISSDKCILNNVIPDNNPKKMFRTQSYSNKLPGVNFSENTQPYDPYTDKQDEISTHSDAGSIYNKQKEININSSSIHDNSGTDIDNIASSRSTINMPGSTTKCAKSSSHPFKKKLDSDLMERVTSAILSEAEKNNIQLVFKNESNHIVSSNNETTIQLFKKNIQNNIPICIVFDDGKDNNNTVNNFLADIEYNENNLSTNIDDLDDSIGYESDDDFNTIQIMKIITIITVQLCKHIVYKQTINCII